MRDYSVGGAATVPCGEEGGGGGASMHSLIFFREAATRAYDVTCHTCGVNALQSRSNARPAHARVG